MKNSDHIANTPVVPVRIGGGGKPLSTPDAPWYSPLQDLMYPPGVHGRKQPEPRSGGHAPTIRTASVRTEPTESEAGWPDDPSIATVSLQPDLRRALNIEQAELRAQLAGVEIVPYPQLVKSFVAGSNNTVSLLTLPQQAQLVRFTSSAPFWVSRYPFLFPVTDGGGTQSDNYLDPIIAPSGMWMYCAGMRQLHIGMISSGDAVSCLFYVTQ